MYEFWSAIYIFLWYPTLYMTYMNMNLQLLDYAFGKPL